MNFFKYIMELLLYPPALAFAEDKCAECGELKTVDCLNDERVCTRCATLRDILNASNRYNRCCGNCGLPFISRNDEQDCFSCRGTMKTEQPAPMLDRIRERERLEREMHNGR